MTSALTDISSSPVDPREVVARLEQEEEDEEEISKNGTSLPDISMAGGDEQDNFNESNEDNNDDDEDEDGEDVPSASGSEFSAGSDDIKAREKEDDVLERERLDHLSTSTSLGNGNGNGQISFHYTNDGSGLLRENGRDKGDNSRLSGEGSKQKSSGGGRMSVLNDAELDPDLYGLRRSVSNYSHFASRSELS